ncbi:MAG TPA: enoyl-CoA hydratase-related protein [Longimicrobiales bacterium]|nr:enoyl-CoA hydratase-related protein [Longimicrobiales bacterium]
MQVKVEVQDGVGQLMLDAPPLNILTRSLLSELREALDGLSGDTTLRVLVLGAHGKHFSAGASVEEHLPGVVEEMIPEFMDTVAALRDFPAPVVVAVHGRCLGGALELALAGDLVVAAEGSLLGVPEIALGVFPPAACVQLPRLAGPAVAAELVLTGAPLDASTAFRAGLVRRVVPDERVLEEALSLAGTMARHSAAALRVAKRALRAGARDPAPEAAVTRLYLQDLMRTADAQEGLRSFVEKRTPQWSHS